MRSFVARRALAAAAGVLLALGAAGAFAEQQATQQQPAAQQPAPQQVAATNEAGPHTTPAPRPHLGAGKGGEEWPRRGDCPPTIPPPPGGGGGERGGGGGGGAHAASAEELKDAVLGMDEQSPLPPPARPEQV